MRISKTHLDTIEADLVASIRAFMKTNGFTRTHLGLSGGIDSALVAYLAVCAAGAENVACFSMPSRFSSQGSKDDAREQAALLGCSYQTLPIEAPFTALLSTLQPIFKDTPFGLAEENLQARIRGTLMMAVSNKFGSMLLTTGNKSEIAMGYCTLYGDTAGALAPLGSLFKTEVFALCNRINERSLESGGKKVIVQAIIDKPPSAELRPNQKDEDSLPPYEALDQVLELHLCNKLPKDEIIKRGWDSELVDRILATVKGSSFKRRQMPPIIELFDTERENPGKPYP